MALTPRFFDGNFIFAYFTSLFPLFLWNIDRFRSRIPSRSDENTCWSGEVCASRLNFYLHASMWKCVLYKRRILKDIDARLHWYVSSVSPIDVLLRWAVAIEVFICRFSLISQVVSIIIDRITLFSPYVLFQRVTHCYVRYVGRRSLSFLQVLTHRIACGRQGMMSVCICCVI